MKFTFTKISKYHFESSDKLPILPRMETQTQTTVCCSKKRRERGLDSEIPLSANYPERRAHNTQA